ncbi:condensation domain-containing protein [Nesterenkonia sphaerica]|uniref:Peptide synthetase n=1 Tax=Nesterenkonia sphaerica TaxID=1804988 RepID=A0A5R9APW4_9MICC|nr:condensation domain-containing protein [Nesterenkonia sphaerica]TLP79925.1 peptide synthetase [Nesterenkonia sphaerica]
MRLTNIAQMQVQPGRAYSYCVRAELSDAAASKPLPVSFDQERHVGFGPRPGSWMAVSFSLPVHADREVIAQGWMEVVERHGTLRTVFLGADEGNGRKPELVLTSVSVEPGEWEQLGDGSAMTPTALRAVIREHFDLVCRSLETPSYRLCVVEDETGVQPPQVIIGSDHAHVDAWSLLVLTRDLATCVQNLQAGREPTAGLPPTESFADHTRALEQEPAPPREVIERWREILHAGGHAMPTFPLDLGDLSEPVGEFVEIRDVFDAEELAQVEAHAAEHRVRLIAVAVSVMTRLAAELSGEPLRAVFPVHSRHGTRWFDSVGWFITNSVLESHEEDYQDCYRSVKEAIRLGSYPLAPIMRPYGGMPQSPGMFAMSWLDHRKLPVNVDDDLNPQHVSAVIRTDGVMIWFVINHTGLHLRCRYPDTRQARRSMRTWLAGLVYGLRAPLEHHALREIRANSRR